MDKSKPEPYYVYEHWRLDLQQPFYVGKGKGSRHSSHLERNPYWYKVIAELHDKSQPFETRFIAINLSEAIAFELEKARIALWKSRGIELTNLTDGGVGNYKMKGSIIYIDGKAQSINGKPIGRPSINRGTKKELDARRSRRYRARKKAEREAQGTP